MNDQNCRRVVNFVFADNNAGSLTQIAAHCANQLADQGREIHVSYPVFDFWDYHKWLAAREAKLMPAPFKSGYQFLKFRWYLLKKLLGKVIIRSKGIRWEGAKIYKLDARIKLHRFWALPSVSRMPDAEVMIVLQNYLIPHLLFLPASKGKIIGCVAMDYRDMLKYNEGSARDWARQFLSVDQQLNVPRFAVSTTAKISAEVLGVPVRCVIPLGVDVREFGDGDHKIRDHAPLRAMLFCAPSPLKGQDFGCQVVRELKKIYTGKQVRFVSVGQVKEEYKSIFDENLGYLYGQDYIQAYKHADIFIYPSLSDGFPAPPLEALASGCALVTTAVQGVVEYGVHEQNCLISKPGDVGDMMKNVRRLIEDSALRINFSKEGVATAKMYSWEMCANKLIDFMNEIAIDARYGPNGIVEDGCKPIV